MTSGNPLHERPTAAQEVAVVAEFLEKTIGPAVSGNHNAQAEVTAAANALRTAERELLGDSANDGVSPALAGPGFAEEAQLAAEIHDDPQDAEAADHARPDTRGRAVTTTEQLSDRLPAVLAPALGLDSADITIDNLRALTRTYNRTTWAFDAVTPYGRRALILGLHTEKRSHVRAGVLLQAGVQIAAAARGVPVPRIVDADDPGDALGYPFLISEMVTGVTDYVEIVGQLDSADPRGGRARLLRQCALALATLHRVVQVPEGARQDRLAIYRRELDALDEASATFEWAFRWLTAHRPPPSPAVVAHGDYCMANLLVDGTDLRAVLDWEWVHIGEAYEDLAWFCVRAWRYGAPASLGAGGLGSIEDFLRAYEKASGTNVDRAVFHWWLVMATLFRGLTLREIAQTWLKNKVNSPSLAVAGRRACETEWDLLNLLDGTHPDDDAGRARSEMEPGNQAQPRDDAGGAARGGATPLQEIGQSDPAAKPAVYGRPAAPELVAAVAKFLETTIGPAASGHNAQAEVTAAADVLRVVERELLDDARDDAGPARRAVASMMSGSPRHGRPTAAESLAAVADFIGTTIGPAAHRQRNAHTRDVVTAAADALRIVERELLAGSADEVTHALASLGFADEVQLAAAIRNGDLDHRGDDVTSCLRAVVNHRLAVINPGYGNE